ncbi:uncharacterized protein with FMN-binding domain [Aurantimicrobium minutum]|uniref:FMN-binding protein n=1 Tax=Aurantimicrobium minutum TaxID=708131 RepID=UPI002474069D|nr:FMN-binding protein [Aurantimicrobium minutum]MDH6409948.1 uncharacterized protein with FMN-binding domain [Aurantimicrobium minutum]MDH6424143.1 uncharacterized protein with FMN-binding domain [Aurantimicrobium minutum]
MRAGSAFFAGVGSAAIVAIGWQAGVGTLVSSLPQSQAAASGTTAGASSSTSSNSATTDTSSQAAATAPVASGPADGTYDGSVVNTRFGTVQVQAVISGGKITDVIAVKLTDADRKSIQISQQVAPMVRSEVLTAQSAKVANISGGTYTTQAYLQSLQSALDAAGFTG